MSTTEGPETGAAKGSELPENIPAAPATDAASGLPVEVDQAALAQKVDALFSEKDDVEILARSEEAKLEARTGGRAKSALEEAASKRLAEIGTKKAKKVDQAPEAQAQAEAQRRAAVSSALSTPDRVSDFVERNSKALGIVLAAAAVLLVAFGGYSYASEKKREQASTELGQALSALDARIVTPEQAKNKSPQDANPGDGPTYGTLDERAEAALVKLESVQKNFPGTGPGYLAELTRASVLAQQGKFDEALAAYKSAKATPLGKADLEISLRAAEGIGAAHEAIALRHPEKKVASLEAAIGAYKELIDSGALGFAELGQYHTARVYEQQGDLEKAKGLYHALLTKLTRPAEDRPLGTYLEAVVTVRLQAIDPSFQPPRAPPMGGESKMDERQIKKLLEELKKNPGKGGPVEDAEH